MSDRFWIGSGVFIAILFLVWFANNQLKRRAEREQERAHFRKALGDKS